LAERLLGKRGIQIAPLGKDVDGARNGFGGGQKRPAVGGVGREFAGLGSVGLETGFCQLWQALASLENARFEG